jgi:G3E family GTPase
MDGSLSRRPAAPIPLTVVTGFLGAGKTTLLNRLLKDPALSDTIVVVNEFGDVGLDHLLMETVDDGMVLMSAGCLCCTIRGDLVRTLEDLLRRMDNGRLAPFKRVVIETTGLADPAPVLHTVMAHPYLTLRYALQGVVTLVDAVNGEATLDRHKEAVKQAAVADLLVISKTDLLADDPERLKRLRMRLQLLAPGARMGAAHQITAADLIGSGPYSTDGKAADVLRWLNDEALLQPGAVHVHADGTVCGPETPATDGRGQDPRDANRHDQSIRAFAFRSEPAIPTATFALFQDLLRSAHGARLLRVKGLVKLTETPLEPVVIHGVQHVFHPPRLLPRWPSHDHASRLVFITDGLEQAFVEGLWKAFLGADPAPTSDERHET